MHRVVVMGVAGSGKSTVGRRLADVLGVEFIDGDDLHPGHNVSKMAWNVPGGALADHFGPRRAIIAGWAVYALAYAGFAFASREWHIWALFALYGLFYGLTEAPILDSGPARGGE